jgi:carbon monoxide dehydrogenase subunit G
MMQTEGSHRTQASAQGLWQSLEDPARLGAALPGVGEVKLDGPDRFTARVRPSTGVGVTPLDLDVRILEREQGRMVRLAGDGVGGEHRIAFDVTLRFADEDGGGARVDWDARVQAYGGLASLAQRVLPALLNDQITIALRTAELQAG